MKKENIWNVPNILTLSRVFLTFVVIYMIISEFNIISIVSVFALAALTDGLDGIIARKFNLITEFGRKFDIFADRLLMIGVWVTFLIYVLISKETSKLFLSQFFLIIMREIISLPFALFVFMGRKKMVEVRLIGKVTTLLQGITFPMIMISLTYPFFKISIYFSILTAIIGTISGIIYLNDWNKLL